MMGVRVERGLEGKGDFDDLKGGGAAQLRKKTTGQSIRESEKTSGDKKTKDPRIRPCHHTKLHPVSPNEKAKQK
jgi:hypothetical protein